MKLLGFLLAIYLTTATQQVSTSERKAVKVDETITVDCSLIADAGIFWFRQAESSKPAFLLYISGVGKVTPDSSKHTAIKTNRRVSLTVKNFTKEDSGKYYCVEVNSKRLDFGNMNELYLEEVNRTSKPTTIPTTTKAKSAAPGTKQTILCHTTKPGIADDNLSCHIFIWAPLTGAAFLLLVALAFVSIVYFRRPRRRRCQHQFRKRPISEEDRRPSNRYY
ncbi:T-cell surface glycoprotein CD8 alpha chain isoform X2 [Heptranchias perlo]|uniref:T-cell surface glycoprotein CD8 alpha chain isoform X2 n=1 Tax=Heptranchias perlo TaxID=212740 RepID=UPI00355A6E39